MISDCEYIRRETKKKKGGVLELLSTPETRRRAREHLESLGYRFDYLDSLKWPKNAVGGWYRDGKWEFKYKDDILREKKEKMESNLERKRTSDRAIEKYLYVWVFWCPGISGIYRGWYMYFIGFGVREGADFQCYKKELIEKVKTIFPVPGRMNGLFDEEPWRKEENYKTEFARQYQKGIWCGKPQGKGLIKALVKNHEIMEIICRVNWPKIWKPCLRVKAQTEPRFGGGEK